MGIFYCIVEFLPEFERFVLSTKLFVILYSCQKNMDMKNMNLLVEIESDSKLPKYQQFVNSILEKINTGELKEGDRLPSIVNSSIDFELSRDTISRAYKELFTKGVITSIYRKGYFVSNVSSTTRNKRVLFVTGKCSTSNQMFYNQIAREMEKHHIQTDYMLSHNNLSILKNIINKEAGNYHIFIIEPQILSKNDILKIFNKRTVRSNIIFLNDDNEYIPEDVNHVSFNIDDEFFSILNQLSGELEEYKSLKLVLPEYEYFPSGLINGFFRYCDSKDISGSIVEELNEIEKGCGYFVVDEHTLFNLAELMESQNLSVGKDVGLITLFEKDYLKYMFNGITSINWFNGNLARVMARYIVDNNMTEQHWPAELYMRNSI